MVSAVLSARGFCLTKCRCTQFHYPVLAVSCGMFSAQMGGVLLLLQRHCKWSARFCREQRCCGSWLWVLFLKVTQAFPSLGISAWVPP